MCTKVLTAEGNLKLIDILQVLVGYLDDDSVGVPCSGPSQYRQLMAICDHK